MKIRSDSLCATLGRLGHLDSFFGYVAADNPGYQEMRDWLSERHVQTSNGALHNLITYHMGQWRVRQAVAAADEAVADLPPDTDAKIRARLHGLRLDLALRDLSEKTAVSLLKLDLAERELAAKTQSLHDAGVAALMSEAKGNQAAEAALKVFLAALDQDRSKEGTPHEA